MEDKAGNIFTYLPGLACPIILGRDFISRQGIVLDVAVGQYQYGRQFPPLKFAVRPTSTPDPPLEGAVCDEVAENYPTHEGVRVAVSSFTGTDSHRTLLTRHLDNFSHMFAQAPGKTNILEHRIDTGDARPIRFNARPLSVHKRTLLDAALDEMIMTGAVRPSKSPWAFPIVL